jgi:tRNA U34 5-methylaminomethyl-2-thiouridine-forming methyltransferase MnmC
MTLRHILTEDGSSTLFVPELNEHYHSVHGAVQESMHIFIRAGYDAVRENQVHIFEAGFGTGLNAFLTFLSSRKDKRIVHYTAVEKYPLENSVVKLLNYPGITDPADAAVFSTIHTAPWGEEVKISDHFFLHKMEGDLLEMPPKEDAFNLVYFDAFGPDVQPELWAEEVFRMLFRSMKENAILVTYSVKGTVTRALKAAGFNTEKLPGPPGKRQITRATKKS